MVKDHLVAGAYTLMSGAGGDKSISEKMGQVRKKKKKPFEYEDGKKRREKKMPLKPEDNRKWDFIFTQFLDGELSCCSFAQTDPDA